ncbi:RagB/SusD family nutrient uptake outer membrane protein [uncultured Chitinophaga sp.]|uniref:RagB/SusD family nutrient uptake outer membrane protein n=1 Tax=uncultured Chitinophaga sp. TaxID=339340 RepID=UPI0025F29A4A|nr:RagB/SusD family nutrient uptake outer membrane protein [uncultured Chitinophaga sp.]
MKAIKHKIYGKLLLTGLGASVVLGACTKNFEKLNTNPYAVTEDAAQGDFKILGAPIRQMQMNIYTVDPTWVAQLQTNLNSDIYSGYMMSPNPFGTNSNNITYALHDGWNDFIWTTPYTNIMPAFKYIGARAKGKFDQFYAWAQILRVMAMHRVSDVFGPIIYTKYGVINPDGSITYDSQKEAYYAFFQDLKEAIDVLTPLAINPPAVKAFTDADLVYAGNYTQWVKFANSLRLRLAIRIAKVDPQKAQSEGEAALANPAGLMTTTGDDFNINIAPVLHPLNTFSGVWTDIRMGAPMESYLTGYSDPRLSKYFKSSSEYKDAFKGIRQGVDLPDKNVYVNFSALAERPSTLQLLTAAEVWFLKAEAKLRGWNGINESVQECYEKGIETSFDQNRVASELTRYKNDAVSKPAPYIDPKNNANSITAADPHLSTITIKWDEAATFEIKLERIITQKWIAIFPDGQEAWTEYRRTGYPKLFPVVLNKSNGTINTETGIRRINFVTTERTTNAKGVENAVTLLGGADNGGTRLWWDKL